MIFEILAPKITVTFQEKRERVNFFVKNTISISKPGLKRKGITIITMRIL